MIRIPEKDKIKFLKRNKKMAEKVFKSPFIPAPFPPYKKKFIKSIRDKFGYSRHTVDCDIFLVFNRAWIKCQQGEK